MSNYYVYQRLEDLVHELNPTIVQPYPLAEGKVSNIIDEIKREKQRVQTALQDQFYNSNEGESTAQLIRKSHHSLVLLINKSFDTRNHELAHKMNVVKPLDDLLHALDQLLHWFHQNFNGYLTPLQPYPITKLRAIRSLILEKLDYVRDVLRKAGNEDAAIEVVCQALNEFVLRIDNRESITKHEADYHKDLLKDIERTNGHSQIVSNCPSLHELLVYWNLNSKQSFSYFTKGLEEIISSYDTIPKKLDYLRLQYKYVHQMPELPDFKYDVRYPSIKEYFCDYLLREIKHATDEIEYMNKKNAGPQPSERMEKVLNDVEFKLLCNLSVDQLSLILRAMYEIGLISARSLSMVFKTLSRYLATPHTEDISWENMRRKSYAGESKDKKNAIQAMLRLAEKIKEY